MSLLLKLFTHLRKKTRKCSGKPHILLSVSKNFLGMILQSRNYYSGKYSNDNGSCWAWKGFYYCCRKFEIHKIIGWQKIKITFEIEWFLGLFQLFNDRKCLKFMFSLSVLITMLFSYNFFSSKAMVQWSVALLSSIKIPGSKPASLKTDPSTIYWFVLMAYWYWYA